MVSYNCYLQPLAVTASLLSIIFYGVYALADIKPPANSYDVPAFLYEGIECPAGSYIYRGPEAKLLKKQKPGFMYCRVMTEVMVFRITDARNTCPDGTAPYEPEDVKPDEGYMWCTGKPVVEKLFPF